ncbi:MAG: peptide chain release factor 2 [Minisyncoccia bacterium]
MPCGTVFDLGESREKIKQIETEMQAPGFWNNNEKAGKASKELNDLKTEVEFWETTMLELDEFGKMSDEEIQKKEIEIRAFKKNFDKEYIKIFLSGKYDKGNALLYVYSGAGGVDAQDWASMLLRMYQKYAEREGYGWTLLQQSFGEQNGTKSAVAEITGRWAYGKLRGEAGVHRLVRISPFSAKSLRHTSFALVDVLPEIEDVKINIDPKDLRIDTFRSSGPGGQNVNKLETAVRITHIPTNLTVAVQSERSQAQNKAKAMTLLQSRLAQLMEEKKIQEISELRLDTKDSAIEWGSQIRSYVIHPYKMVKDHRTEVETTQVDKVLEGELDEFIEKELVVGRS